MKNKEEQKQHLIDMMRGDEELGLYEESKQENCCTAIGQIKRYVDCVGCDRKPEKLTVEEALLLVRNAPMTFVPNKRMYSEEEVYNLLYNLACEVVQDYDHTPKKLDKWFEQFKKK